MTSNNSEEVKRLVVVGGAGYLGRFLVDQLSVKYPKAEIIVVSRNRSKAMFFLGKPRVSVVSTIRGLNLKKGAIYNLAYEIGTSFRQSRQFAKQLADDLLVGLHHSFSGPFIHVSSIAVHGGMPSMDTVQPEPIRKSQKENLYSETKACIEQVLYRLCLKAGVQLFIVRSGNIMGPGSIWSTIIARRLAEGLPLLGKNMQHPSNTTYVGNLAHGLAQYAQVTDIHKSMNIQNFAEFGNVAWDVWVEAIAQLMNRKPVHWETDDIADFKPSLREDVGLIYRKALSTAFPLVSKGRASSRVVARCLDFIPNKDVKGKAKAYVADSNEKSLAYIEEQEYGLAQLFLQKTVFGVEGSPDGICNCLPYDLDAAQKSIENWARFCELKRT